MVYTTDIDNRFGAVIHCLKMLDGSLVNANEWKIDVKEMCIDYGLYLNFDTDNLRIEISNYPASDNDSYMLDEIIDMINEELDDEYEEEDDE